MLCGGFPCQDISLAGKGAGIDGARSGLWSEFARLIGEFRPRYVCVENVSALLGRGLDRVLSDLAALGFDAEWDCIPASAVGAPHIRDRVWLIAYPHADSNGLGGSRNRTAVRDGSKRGIGKGHIGTTLTDFVWLWPTPRASERENRSLKRTPSQKAGKHGLYLASEVNEAQRFVGKPGGHLNPTWVEWLMGFPLGWTDLEA